MLTPRLAALLAILLVLAARRPEAYQVTVSPRLALPPVGDVVPNFHIVARLTEPLTEANYCTGIAVTWPDGTRSSHVQDCPPFAEYQQQQARWEECSQRVVVCPPGYTCGYNCTEPFDLQREWVFDTARRRMAFDSGRYTVYIRFLLPNEREVLRQVSWDVTGGSEQ